MALSFMLAPFICARTLAAEGTDPFVHPPELERDVRFWIRVYTEVTTEQGLLHDDWNLGLVYEVLRFAPAASPSQRERRVAEAKARYAALLRRFAAGETDDLTAHERRILHTFGEGATRADLIDAIGRIRFQLGQADRFHEGLIRAVPWEAHIARVLEQHGVPKEIAALPHVESSFNPAAYSKVGAAGLWQLMRSTGRRFLRIDAAVDERMDPFRETEAAAQLLNYNYRLLGSWPLAITAYNHGSEGMRRAREQLGTDDIARIVREYRSPTFGFASRNFYVSFLAALSIAQDPDKYFGPLHRGSESQFVEVKLSTSASSATLVRTLGVDRDTLRGLNPALRPGVWTGQRSIPAGYVVRLPGSASKWTSVLLAQRLGASKPVVVAEVTPPANLLPPATSAQPTAPPTQPTAPAPPETNVAADAASSQYYLVQSDDTVSTIAARTGVTVNKLMALNSIPDQEIPIGSFT